MSDFDSVGWSSQPLLHRADLLKCRTVPHDEVLERFNVANEPLLAVRVLHEVIAHELLFSRLHDLIQVSTALSTERVETADVPLQYLLLNPILQ